MDLQSLNDLETPELFHIITVIVGILYRRFVRSGTPIIRVACDEEAGVPVEQLHCPDYQLNCQHFIVTKRAELEQQ